MESIGTSHTKGHQRVVINLWINGGAIQSSATRVIQFPYPAE